MHKQVFRPCAKYNELLNTKNKKELKMSLIKYEGFAFPTLSRFFNDEAANYPTTNAFQHRIPAVNVKESENAFEVELAAPGLKKEDFKIELNNNTLSISAEKKLENSNKKGDTYTRREFSFQSFRRSFTISEKLIARDNIAANYTDGVLKINLPKKEEAKAKPAQQIAID